VAIVPAALWHSKPLFAPKTLHFLVIDCPAFCTGVVIPGPEMAQPGPQTSHPDRGGSRDRQYVSIRDLRERNFLQFRISQKPLERGVFTLKGL
jgi:hypothetical protein